MGQRRWKGNAVLAELPFLNLVADRRPADGDRQVETRQECLPNYIAGLPVYLSGTVAMVCRMRLAIL
jgi:hypothetical protein